MEWKFNLTPTVRTCTWSARGFLNLHAICHYRSIVLPEFPLYLGEDIPHIGSLHTKFSECLPLGTSTLCFSKIPLFHSCIPQYFPIILLKFTHYSQYYSLIQLNLRPETRLLSAKVLRNEGQTFQPFVRAIASCRSVDSRALSFFC